MRLEVILKAHKDGKHGRSESGETGPIVYFSL